MRLQNTDCTCMTFAKFNLEDEIYCSHNHSQTTTVCLGLRPMMHLNRAKCRVVEDDGFPILSDREFKFSVYGNFEIDQGENHLTRPSVVDIDFAP